MNLTVSVAQIQVSQCDPPANLEKAAGLIKEAARRGSDLICFPEMWTTGFNWQYNEAHAVGQEAVIDAVARLAAENGIWINGTMLALNEEGLVSNTSLLFSADGKRAGTYRKIHLFSFIGEERHMAPGQYTTTVETRWGLFGLSICYDLRFPELFRTYALKGVKVQMLPAAFPHPRLDHWKILVRARAIENQMFMIATNQVGSENLGSDSPVAYFGSSCIIDPWGRTVIEAGEREEVLLTVTIDTAEVDTVRSKMKVLADRRPDLYELSRQQEKECLQRTDQRTSSLEERGQVRKESEQCPNRP